MNSHIKSFDRREYGMFITFDDGTIKWFEYSAYDEVKE